MKTLVIPGYSTKNREWAETTAQKLGGEVFEWAHWADINIKFSPKIEAEKITSLTSDPANGGVNIIAKSIGSYVTMLALKNIKINKLILCGICKNDLNEDELRAYRILSDIDPSKVLVFQNTKDEHGGFEDVRSSLSQINPQIKIVEKPGSTHDYPYYDEFKNFLS